MALIHCIECNKQVSSQAAACPHCGFPLGPDRADLAFRARTRRTLIGYTIICAIGLPIGIALKLWHVVLLGLAGLVIGLWKLRRPAQHGP